ncbi:transcriptional regulator, AraC family (plasmid) [Acaryochloris marina MBIC11017]|uniref:Transcriptional regulator, AraC family n=2 Tax=Acaryochloris marina TaxID=155978 RepID=A8ZKG7_ACAM1|nr:transcriptional regulator, AraC family [Acaryochloris marina MBIC11017]
MEIMTRTAYNQQWLNTLDSHGSIVFHSDFDVMASCSHRFSKDQVWGIQFSPIFCLEASDSYYHRDLCVRNTHDAQPQLVAKFYLSGEHHVHSPNIPNIPTEYCERAGYSYLFSLPEIEEKEIYLANQRLHLLRIYVDPCWLQKLGASVLPLHLQMLLNADPPYRFHQCLGKMTPTMHAILQQILNCPYKQGMRRLYLESKAQELLVLQLEQWLALEQGNSASTPLKAADLDYVHLAADILDRELSHPPSIAVLARRVGLNEYKLKVGFRQVFGQTVFGYVKVQRLERAKQLLLIGGSTVTQAAASVGYVSQGHFAAAFRQQFGVNPRTLRQ